MNNKAIQHREHYWRKKLTDEQILQEAKDLELVDAFAVLAFAKREL